MRNLKRILSYTIATLVVLSASVFLIAPKVSAIGFSKQGSIIELNPLFTDQKDLEVSISMLLEKEKTVNLLSKEVNSIVEEKQSLKEEVTDLKSQVESLEDMFVKIDKYAPDSAGNRYSWGYCTYYVKNKRPDMSNSWGNANTWYYRAKYQGWNVGEKPKKGAIATTVAGWLGHVAYVEKVTPDGQWVTVSEMNYGGFNRISSRVVHYTEFRYIYELN